MKSRLVAGIAMAGMLGLSACATSEDVVPINYAVSSAPKVAGAERITVTVASTDARTQNRARIGAQINGYGMEMAAIRAETEITEVVRNALAAELRQRGYGIGETGARINAAVDTFYNDFSVGMFAGKSTADVVLTVTVIGRDGREAYRRQVSGQVARTVQIANGGNAATTLAQALSAALADLMADADFTAALSH